MKPEDKVAFEAAWARHSATRPVMPGDKALCGTFYELALAHRDAQALAHVNETPKNEHDSDDVLKRAPMVRLTEEQIEQGAKKLAELFDYPWDYMPEKGKGKMRGDVQSVFETMIAKNGG